MGSRNRNNLIDRSRNRLNNALDIHQQTYEALYLLYGCFNDEGVIEEVAQDQLSIALEKAEAALGVKRIKNVP